jgi:hypothetical protein
MGEDMAKRMQNGGKLAREERLQIMLRPDEIAALDEFRFNHRMPSRAAAIRELIRRGLSADGFTQADSGQKSSDFGILEERNK